MPKLILLRHGQSEWNLENRFTGTEDIGLTSKGEAEAKSAGLILKNMRIDLAYTSVLKRAIDALKIVLLEIGIKIPIIKSAALNERSYGHLQGLNKLETVEKYGLDQVLQWRRSFLAKPPGGESLKDTFDRVVPYYQNEILPKLQGGRTILIVAHGNSLRALVMYLENLNELQIEQVNIETGIPIVYDFSHEKKLKNPVYMKENSVNIPLKNLPIEI